MRILVTGGCGFIGTNLIRELLASTNHQLSNLDKLSYAGIAHSLEQLADSAAYRFYQVDLADAEATLQAVVRAAPDAVIHLAAETHVDRSISGPDPFIQSNVVGTYNLLQACVRYYRSLPPTRQASFRLVHVSTDEVFGTLGVTGQFTETSPYAPRSPYSASKAAADHLVRAWATTFELPILVTISSNNYGPYQFPEKLVPLSIINALAEKPLAIYGTGAQVRDWLHVSDHVRALLAVLDRGTLGATYLIGGNQERSNLDLVRNLCHILDELRPRAGGATYASLIRHVADRPGHDFRYALDCSKTEQELGWRPQCNLEDGLRSTVEWYLEHTAWWRPLLPRATGA